MSNSGVKSRSANYLPAMSGVRLPAALAIYVFHLTQIHHSGLMRFPVIDGLPSFVTKLLEQGFVATGFFFCLSGFLLTWVNLNNEGILKSSVLSFIGRRLRLVPIYLLSLALLAPAPLLLPISKPMSIGCLIANVTLMQSWIPSYAISMNAPAWALSALMTYYLLFPAIIVLTRKINGRALVLLAYALSILGMVPAFLLYLVDESCATATSTTVGNDVLNQLRFSPASWACAFFSGVFYARYLKQNLPATPGKSKWAFSDVLLIGIIGILAFGPTIPYVLLRHGLLGPVYLLVIKDLTLLRGALANVLAHRAIVSWSRMSFALFALQMPIGMWFAVMFLRSHESSSLGLLALITTTLGVSLAVSDLGLLFRKLNSLIGRTPAKLSHESLSPGVLR